MRILEVNFDVEYNWNLQSSDWIYKVEVMNAQQLEFLLNEEQYEKSNKVIAAPGIL